jgi:hypothetical protein
MMENQLDRERIKRLMAAILTPIRENYIRGPTERDRCLEALNALAASAALVIEGADGPGGEARAFFDKAILQHLGPAVPDPEHIELALALKAEIERLKFLNQEERKTIDHLAKLCICAADILEEEFGSPTEPSYGVKGPVHELIAELRKAAE